MSDGTSSDEMPYSYAHMGDISSVTVMVSFIVRPFRIRNGSLSRRCDRRHLKGTYRRNGHKSRMVRRSLSFPFL